MTKLLTIKDLAKRWQSPSEDAVREIVRKHSDILRPARIGRRQLFELADVQRFEDSRREISDKTGD